MLGKTHTRSAQSRRRTGYEIIVYVSPNRLITIPVPNKENTKEIVLVIYREQEINDCGRASAWAGGCTCPK